jgi:hypothetical protein
MKFKGGSFGLLGVLIVLAIVLYLVAQNWQKLAFTTAPGADAHGEHAASAEVQSGDLPDLPQTQAATDDHTAEVNAALEQID